MMENIGQTKEKHETNDTKHKTGDLISREASTDHLKKRLLETAFNQTERYAAEMCEDIAVNRLDVWLGELPAAEPEHRWIPVNERLPEDMTYVLVTIRTDYKGYKVRSSYYSHGYFCNDNGDCWRVGDEPLLAWMPQPELYTEEKKK